MSQKNKKIVSFYSASDYIILYFSLYNRLLYKYSYKYFVSTYRIIENIDYFNHSFLSFDECNLNKCFQSLQYEHILSFL